MTVCRSPDCPLPTELARAASDGADLDLQSHLAECGRCALDWQAQLQEARLDPALLDFTRPPPGPPRLRVVRADERLPDPPDAPVTASGLARRPSRPIVGAVAATVVAAGVALVLLVTFAAS